MVIRHKKQIQCIVLSFPQYLFFIFCPNLQSGVFVTERGNDLLPTRALIFFTIYFSLLVPFTLLKKKTCVFNIPKWAYHWSDCFAHSRWIDFHLLFPNSLKLRRTCFGYVVHNDIPPSSHNTKALNLVTPGSIEILWQLVIKWENGPGPVFSRRFLLNLALLMKHSLCYL